MIYIAKFKDCYLEWSTITDCPASYGMTLEAFTEHYRSEYGPELAKNLPSRLQRVHENGTSALDKTTLPQLIAGNRAGPNEEELTFDEIFELYCTEYIPT